MSPEANVPNPIPKSTETFVPNLIYRKNVVIQFFARCLVQSNVIYSTEFNSISAYSEIPN